MNRQRLLERFLRYVALDTTARAGAGDTPSSPGQLALGRLLVEELVRAGISDARQDLHGIVTASVPATVPGRLPVIAFLAHLDTSPECPGAGVRPQVIENYSGGDLELPGALGQPSTGGQAASGTRHAGGAGQVIRVEENPELAACAGRTLITTDGTTLLGADDKAGVAAIMEAAAWMREHPEHRRGPVRLCFTCDEEIGRGVDHLDLRQLGATAAYTLDGQGADAIDVETFSADLATVILRGVSIHPSIAKGRMTNAVRVAADFLSRLPQSHVSPETTEGRQPFLHPYEIQGGVEETRIRVLLRDFNAAGLARLADRLRQAAAATTDEFPQAKIEVAISRQYRNIAEGLAREPRAVACAQRALERLSRTARLTIVRGGTDGARLTERGLPTPNLSTGQHNPHSPLEWACLEEIAAAAEWIAAIASVWAGEPS
jgi:tripeptide aminopeptidase